jgi:hypothetical protein
LKAAQGQTLSPSEAGASLQWWGYQKDLWVEIESEEQFHELANSDTGRGGRLLIVGDEPSPAACLEE